MNETTIVKLRSRLCLRAILAGSLVAVSTHLLLTMLGAGITALVVTPSASGAGGHFTLGMALSWSLSALVALWLGGYVAGKIGAPDNAEDGKLHGFIVWSLATIGAFALLAAGVGKALNIAGQAAAGAGQAVAQAAPSLIEKSAAVINEYSGEVTQNGQPLTPAAKREIAAGLTTYFTTGEAGRSTQNRDALIAAVSKHTKLTPEESAKTVDEWTVSFDRAAAQVKASADTAIATAKDAADRASRATGAAAIWTFFAFWVGAVTAAWGGKLGAVGCHPAFQKDGRPVLKPAHA